MHLLDVRFGKMASVGTNTTVKLNLITFSQTTGRVFYVLLRRFFEDFNFRWQGTVQDMVLGTFLTFMKDPMVLVHA